MTSKYKTAAQLGILPEERTALIAFVDAPALGRTIAVNGHAHYYDQGRVDSEELAEANECGTAGCVAGFVFAHVRRVQGKRSLRGARDAELYINRATDYDYEADGPTVPFLEEIFSQGEPQKLSHTKKVVDKALRTGHVDW